MINHRPRLVIHPERGHREEPYHDGCVVFPLGKTGQIRAIKDRIEGLRANGNFFRLRNGNAGVLTISLL